MRPLEGIIPVDEQNKLFTTLQKSGAFLSYRSFNNKENVYEVNTTLLDAFSLTYQGKDKFKTKKFAQRLLNKRWNGKGPNITATSLPDDYVHYSQPRSLTVREWARLQMFPDWYQFKGKRTTGGLRRAGNPQKGIFDREVPKYTQIGNAVPVELAKRLGEKIIKLLK